MVIRPTNCVTWSYFTGTKGKELTGLGYLTINVRNYKKQCLAYCQRSPSCWSVNYESVPLSDYSLCILNSMDDISYPQLLIGNPRVTYYRKVSPYSDI